MLSSGFNLTQSAMDSSHHQDDGKQSLIIAVCILGTFVAIVVMMAVSFLIYYRCCNQRNSPRPWGRRRNNNRDRLAMVNIDAGSNCHFTSDLLPSNRTGASENLGIRSPNPHHVVPALRCPADFSPSPPFPCEAMKTNSNTCARDRMPTPPRHIGQNNLSFQNGHTSDSDSDYCHGNSVKRKGQYEQLPSCSPRLKRYNCCNKEKISSRFSENLYAVSSKESMTADEDYPIRKHSAVFTSRHHSGNRSSLAATHNHNSKKSVRCAVPRNSGCHNSHDDSYYRSNRSSNSSRLKQHRHHQCENERSATDIKQLKFENCCSKERAQPIRKSIVQKQLEAERETRDGIPLASSSRNTSVDYCSSSMPSKRKNTDIKCKTDTYADSHVNFQVNWNRKKVINENQMAQTLQDTKTPAIPTIHKGHENSQNSISLVKTPCDVSKCSPTMTLSSSVVAQLSPPSLLLQNSNHSSIQSIKPPMTVSPSFTIERTECDIGSSLKYSSDILSNESFVDQNEDLKIQTSVLSNVSQAEPGPPTESSKAQVGHSTVASTYTRAYGHFLDLPRANSSRRNSVTLDICELSYLETDMEPTASMSWDHLTPDPSPPLFQDHAHFLFPHMLAQSSNGTPQRDQTSERLWDSYGSNTADLEHYGYLEKGHGINRYIRSLELNCSTRKAANLNPAIELEMTNKVLDSAKDCTSMENTGKRHDIPMKRTNMAEKFKELDSI